MEDSHDELPHIHSSKSFGSLVPSADPSHKVVVKRKKISPKDVKESFNQSRKKKQPRFGICFDIDGVLARGTLPIPAAAGAMRHLVDKAGKNIVPITYVTNSLNRTADKAKQIRSWFHIQVHEDQLIQAPAPLKVYQEFHDKHCLIVGQGLLRDIVTELGFTNVCFMDDIIDAYPLLDMVNHANRRRVAQHGYVEKSFPRVEAIVLLGEPAHWESSLQVIVDLLKTDGLPDHAPDVIPEPHLPVLACNMDLEFMDRAVMPRYGHGAYLLCLEALYLKCTGHELEYTALVGKPSEVTFRYAEHILTQQAKKMGIHEPLERMYLIGDTPEVDIVGANFYQRFIHRLRVRQNNKIADGGSLEACPDGKRDDLYDPDLPSSRCMPDSADLLPQTVNEIQGVLVSTGCYNPTVSSGSPDKETSEKSYKGHRDFPFNNELYKPATILCDVNDAIEYILNREQILLQ